MRHSGSRDTARSWELFFDGCPMPSENPIRLFQRWFEKARKKEKLPEACCLSTVTSSGKPAARFVLLKQADTQGFVFYTNLTSPKARQLQKNPFAALTFFWPSLNRQVRIEGSVKLLPLQEADRYFATRPRFSQIGAWASRQSRVLPSRLVLIQRFLAYRKKFAGRPVPRPPFWSGFRLQPRSLEFWEGRAYRLHDRFLYRKKKDSWACVRLYP